MNLKSRKIISIALVFFMMLTILPMAPVTAHAAGTLPAPTWSSAEAEKYTIKWDVDDHNATEVWIALYYSGGSKGFYTTNDGSEDLSSYIKRFGSGDYYVRINGEGCVAYSAYSATKTFNFANQLSQPTNVRWDGAVATWDPVEGADRYWFNAYNGSAQILPGNYTTETSMDLTSHMLASGSYTFTVQAYSFGDIAASNMVTSPVKEKDATFYPMDVKFGDGITKDRYLLYWDAIPSTNGYWITVYKDGSQLSGSDGGTDIPVTSIDLETIFARHGNGNYTVRVTAHGATYADKTAEDFISINYQPCTVTLSVEPTGTGVVTGKGTFNKGDNIVVTATAKTGYEFVKWTEGGENVSNGATYNFQISENRNLVAVFKADSSVAFINSLGITGLQAPVAGKTPGTPTATFTPAGAFEVTDAMWLEESNKGVIYGSFVAGKDYLARFRLTPNVGKAFPVDLNKDDITTNLGEVTDVEVKADATYVYVKIKAANETPATTYTVEAYDFPNNSGTITGTGTYSAGSSVTLTATPKEGYRFVAWRDLENTTDLSTNTTYTFTVNENTFVLAKFEKVEGGETPPAPTEINISKLPSLTVGDKITKDMAKNVFPAGLTFIDNTPYVAVINSMGFIGQPTEAEADTNYYLYGTWELKDCTEIPDASQYVVKYNGDKLAVHTGGRLEVDNEQSSHYFYKSNNDGKIYCTVWIYLGKAAPAVQPTEINISKLPSLTVGDKITKDMAKNVFPAGLTFIDNTPYVAVINSMGFIGQPTEAEADTNYYLYGTWELKDYTEIPDASQYVVKYNGDKLAVHTGGRFAVDNEQSSHYFYKSNNDGKIYCTVWIYLGKAAPAQSATEYDITVTGGTASVGAGTAVTKATAGTEITLTANAAPAGQVFDKWEVVSGDVTIEGNKFVMPANAVEVKATYKDQSYTVNYFVTLEYNNGSESAKFLVESGATVTKPADPTREGYIFKGWFLGETEYDFATKVTGPITLTAKWEAVSAEHTHAWGDVTYTWAEDGSSCTAERVCTEDSTHKETATATITSAVKTPATETEKGTTTYTATFAETWAVTQTKDIQDIPVLTHTHTYATEWTTDRSNHWHKATCGHDVIADKAAHSYGNDRVCDICNYKKPSSGGSYGGGSYVAPDKDADNKLRIVMQINNKNILVNGSTITNDVAPVIVGDRTLVPIRVVTELLGGSAHWDNATRTVTLNIDGKTMNMTIGKPIPGFGTSAVIMNDRTYVPVRYVMEKLGAEVEWIGATRQIIIEK